MLQKRIYPSHLTFTISLAFLSMPQGAGSTNTIITSKKGKAFLYSEGYDTIVTVIGLTLQGTQGSYLLSGGLILQVYDVLREAQPPVDVFQSNRIGPKGASYDVIFKSNYKVDYPGGALFLAGASFTLGR